MVLIREDTERLLFRLSAPWFVWTEHGQPFVADGKIEPVFYLDESPDCDEKTSWLLRGATEAACEEAWLIYLDLEAAGVPYVNRRNILPMNLMVTASVEKSPAELSDFVQQMSDHPLKEIREIAGGYVRALADSHVSFPRLVAL